jgi:hypothetical protein
MVAGLGATTNRSAAPGGSASPFVSDGPVGEDVQAPSNPIVAQR